MHYNKIQYNTIPKKMSTKKKERNHDKTQEKEQESAKANVAKWKHSKHEGNPFCHLLNQSKQQRP